MPAPLPGPPGQTADLRRMSHLPAAASISGNQHPACGQARCRGSQPPAPGIQCQWIRVDFPARELGHFQMSRRRGGSDNTRHEKPGTPVHPPYEGPAPAFSGLGRVRPSPLRLMYGILTMSCLTSYVRGTWAQAATNRLPDARGKSSARIPPTRTRGLEFFHRA